MAFATNAERFALISNLDHNGCPFVVRVRTWRGESEIACNDFEHAFDTAHDWKNVARNTSKCSAFANMTVRCLEELGRFKRLFPIGGSNNVLSNRNA